MERYRERLPASRACRLTLNILALERTDIGTIKAGFISESFLREPWASLALAKVRREDCLSLIHGLCGVVTLYSYGVYSTQGNGIGGGRNARVLFMRNLHQTRSRIPPRSKDWEVSPRLCDEAQQRLLRILVQHPDGLPPLRKDLGSDQRRLVLS